MHRFAGGVVGAEDARDAGADVPACGYVALVVEIEVRHQSVHEAGYIGRGEVTVGRWAGGECVAGERGDDEVVGQRGRGVA